MIEIAHSSDQGTAVWGVPREGRAAEILQAAGWCWSRRLDAFHLSGSRYQAVSILHVDEAAAALRAEGFDVSLRIEDERAHRRYALRLAGHQMLYLEGKLSKVDRLLERHFRIIAVDGQTSVGADLWTIRMLIRRIDLEERLRYWRDVSGGLVEGKPTHRRGTPYCEITGHSPSEGPGGAVL